MNVSIHTSSVDSFFAIGLVFPGIRIHLPTAFVMVSFMEISSISSLDKKPDIAWRAGKQDLQSLWIIQVVDG
ncbi:MAG: hypothetical protein HPY65_06995 [Syntrophaceae bacterium]|nr:hypothetical protein [Syntrophaceae bacterium]